MKEEKKSTETGAQLTPVESLSYDDLADKCRLLADDCLKKEKQIEQLENDIKTKSTDALNQARADLQQCKSDLENAYKLLNTKNDDIISLQTQNNGLNEENVDLNQKNAVLAEANGKMQKRITTLEQQLQGANNTIKDRDRTINTKHYNWKQAQKELEETQNELEEERAKPILTILKERCENRRKSRGRVDKPKRQRRRWSRPSFSSIKKPLIITLIVLAILSVIVIPPACLFTDPVYHANVDRINIGDDKDRVLRVLGAPDYGNQGSKQFVYYSSDYSVVDGKESGKSTKVDFNTQGYVTELVYDHDISNASKPIEKVETEYEGELRAFAETLVKYTVKYDDKSIYKSSVKITPDNNGDLRDVFEYTFTVDDAFSDTPIEITLDVYNDVAETVRREGYLRVYKDFTGYRVSSIGDYVLFGEYPQTIKSDDVEVGEVADEDGYYLGSDGCRYAKVEASGGYVIEFSNGDEMKDETYYFKVEPICWSICESYGDEWYLICDSVIDYRQYHSRRGNGYTDQSNNYKNSDIRKWLNDDFYNVAFTPQQQGYIAVTEVDNSAESTGNRKNPYACENTFDKIFLPSYDEMDSFDYLIDFAHYAYSVRNDYNLALGNTTGGNILLRSPYDSILSYVRYIGYTDVTDSVRVGTYYVDNYYQIVPALNLKWNKSAA